jgi:hypothetical protein
VTTSSGAQAQVSIILVCYKIKPAGVHVTVDHHRTFAGSFSTLQAMAIAHLILSAQGRRAKSIGKHNKLNPLNHIFSPFVFHGEKLS